MCLIHIRPTHSPSPEPMLVPSRPITRGVLPSPRASRPAHSHSQPSPRGSGPLQRLSIHSREQFEAQQLRQLSREREAPSPPSEIQAPAPQQLSHPPPSAPKPPSPPARRPSSDRPRAPATRLPPLRRGSDYTYGSAPIPSLSNGSLVATTPRQSQGRVEAAPPLISPAAKDKENISVARHRRRESGVSVMNGKDGSLVERPRLGGGGRSSSLSVGGGRRLSTGAGRRSGGNVGFGVGGEGGGGGSADLWGGNPRGSQRSVRERVVIVEEGRSRREYVRWEG